MLQLKLLLIFFLFGNVMALYAHEITLSGKMADGESGKVLEFPNVALLNPYWPNFRK